MPRLTQEQIDEAVILYNQGYGATTISQKFGCSEHTIRKHVSRRTTLRLHKEAKEMQKARVTDEERAAKARSRRKFYQEELIKQKQDYMLAFLNDKACMDCGYSNILALEFDHRNPLDKEHTICDLMSNSKQLTVLKMEMAKCDVVCRNCHSIRTAKMFGNWKLSKSGIERFEDTTYSPEPRPW